MIGYIYKLTAPNGKIYIGQTIDINRRFGEYSRCKSKFKSKIHLSILKHGWDSFEKEVIYEGNCTIDFLNDIEIYYIKKFNSDLTGLNLQKGGKNGFHSESTKQRMRCSALNRWINNPIKSNHWIGRSHKESSKEKMSKSKKGKKLPDEWSENIRKSLLIRGGKSVINLETGIYYNSIKEASDSIGMNYFTFKNKINGSKNNDTSFIIA